MPTASTIGKEQRSTFQSRQAPLRSKQPGSKRCCKRARVDRRCRRRARVERNSKAHSRVDRRCRRRAAKEDPTSSERALRNPCTKAIKTEICLSEASSFPFSLCTGVLARAGAVLIFASFHLRKRRNIV